MTTATINRLVPRLDLDLRACASGKSLFVDPRWKQLAILFDDTRPIDTERAEMRVHDQRHDVLWYAGSEAAYVVGKNLSAPIVMHDDRHVGAIGGGEFVANPNARKRGLANLRHWLSLVLSAVGLLRD